MKDPIGSILLGICAILAIINILVFIFLYPVIFFFGVFVFSVAYSIYIIGGYFNE